MKRVTPTANTGLLPSPRKGSFGAMKKPTVQPDKVEVEEGQDKLASESAPKSNKRFLNRLSDIASPGEWSTFGRQKEYASPKLGDFGERASSARPPSKSTTLSHSSSGPSQKSKNTKDISPSDTISSKSQAKSSSSPKTPIRPQSASGSFFHGTTSGGENLRLTSGGSESPMTFGYPTPPETRTAGFNFGFGPFTALDEFGRFDSNSRTDLGSSSPPENNLPFPQQSSQKNKGVTYPPHGRRRSSQMDEGTNHSKGTSSSFPQVFGKSSHRKESSSRPQAQQIFNFERDRDVASNSLDAASEDYATASSRRSSLASTTSSRERQNLIEAAGYSYKDKGGTHGSDGLVSKGMDSLFKFERGGGSEVVSGGAGTRVLPHASSHADPSPAHSPFPSSQSLGQVIVQGEQTQLACYLIRC